jgi:hypothetical protein
LSLTNIIAGIAKAQVKRD